MTRCKGSRQAESRKVLRPFARNSGDDRQKRSSIETPESANEIACVWKIFQSKTGPTLLCKQLQKTGQELITMKIYVNSYRRKDGGEHAGYRYFGGKREALVEAREHDHLETKTDSFDIPRTKKGIISALNQYGGHPDNG